MITRYHAKYFAHDILRASTEDNVGKISRSLFDACVDLNPHQIEAALFALQSPLSKGVILADEVGLGKTIEAGIVLCQYWAERKRKLVIVCPASLRKQWSIELEEKFNLPAIIIDSKTYKDAIKNGLENPFNQDKVVICSYQFFKSKQEQAKLAKWDLACIDEAHKLRNAYRPKNVLGQSIKWILEDCKKLLLTATPLQNSLMELFGLSTIIDEYLFGDAKSFRQCYVKDADMSSLKIRLSYFCKRTLREQVTAYVPYTKRKAITIRFSQSDDESKLYNDITKFLQQEESYALPSSQKTLLTLVIRKILSSSSYALVDTLSSIKQRLEQLKQSTIEERKELNKKFIAELVDDESVDDEELEEVISSVVDEEDLLDEESYRIDLKKLDQEMELLANFIEQAKAIKVDSKTKRLVEAIEQGFEQAQQLGASKKVVVFTESRRTQTYLKEYLNANGYEGKIAIFNGTNTDKESNAIYQAWLEANKDTGRISGSRVADKRNSIIEHFRDEAEILIATESAAEGINLQFCSTVINYDLPWNPQRIEQRIGRCHRYGQKYDVVVINFLNERNEVDRRVFDLLDFKFKLFDGVFGASDDVLGSLESGVDFEKEVLKIYTECRHPEEIAKAFDELQGRMEQEINSRLAETQELLVQHFDEDVHARLKVHLEETQKFLDKMHRRFWQITTLLLNGKAVFEEDETNFVLKDSPVKGAKTGKYHLIQKNKQNVDGEFLYRLSHPLGDYVLEKAKGSDTSCVKHLKFNISKHPTKISVVEELKRSSGYLVLNKLTIDSFDKDEYLLFNGFLADTGDKLEAEVLQKLFECEAEIEDGNISDNDLEVLEKDAVYHINAKINETMERNNSYYQDECDRLFKWAEDLEKSANKELKDTKLKIQIANRELRKATNNEERLEIEQRISSLSKQQRKQRQRIFDVEDEIANKRDVLIERLKKDMEQKTSVEKLFVVKWSVV